MSGISVSDGWKIWWYAIRFFVWPAGRKGSLSLAAEEMYRLNVFARSTGRHPIVDQIYTLKDDFVKYLYQHGYCTDVQLHQQKRECYACDGTGEFWTGEECRKCGGTGVYAVTKLYAFRFEIDGKRYAWHQLARNIDYSVTLTPETIAEDLPELRRDAAILSLAEAWKGCCIVWGALLWQGVFVDLMLFEALWNRLRVVLGVDAVRRAVRDVKRWWGRVVKAMNQKRRGAKAQISKYANEQNDGDAFEMDYEEYLKERAAEMQDRVYQDEEPF